MACRGADSAVVSRRTYGEIASIPDSFFVCSFLVLSWTSVQQRKTRSTLFLCTVFPRWTGSRLSGSRFPFHAGQTGDGCATENARHRAWMRSGRSLVLLGSAPHYCRSLADDCLLFLSFSVSPSFNVRATRRIPPVGRPIAFSVRSFESYTVAALADAWSEPSKVNGNPDYGSRPSRHGVRNRPSEEKKKTPYVFQQLGEIFSGEAKRTK